MAAPNRVWAGDITYFWTTGEDWLYPTVVLDLCSRRVIAGANGKTPDSGVGHGGAHHGRRTPTTGACGHTDHGSQYAAPRYRELLAGHGPTASMSRRGNRWDNAVVESFFHTLKTERVHHQHYRTREEARHDIFEWIDAFDNRVRQHSTLGYRSLAEFEAMATGSYPASMKSREDQTIYNRREENPLRTSRLISQPTTEGSSRGVCAQAVCALAL